MAPANISAGNHLITILTAMFMHASWSHIIGNMVFLWALGPEIEDAMGPWRYAAYYILGGIAAMGAQVAFDPHSTIPNLGASAAIAEPLERRAGRRRRVSHGAISSRE
jgi:membrane associated rhomboid family serine protease